MAISTTMRQTLTTVETLGSTANPAISSSNNTVTHDGFNVAVTLNASSDPDGKSVACWEETLSDGAATIDLTNLTGTNGGTVSGDGKRVRALLVKAPSDNGNVITLSKGASNGYAGLGSSFSVDLDPGCSHLFYLADQGDEVSNGVDDTLDLAGTGFTDFLELQVVFG